MLLKYPYLIGGLIMLAVWLVLFLLRSDLRRHMLIFSPFIAICGVIADHWSLQDYWNPPMIFRPLYHFGGIEDLVFCFAIGGITLSAYEIVFRKKLVRNNQPPKYWSLPVFAIIVFSFLQISTHYLNLNSIFGLSVILYLLAATILLVRPDLLLNALVSGLFFSAVYCLGLYLFLPHVQAIIGQSWRLSNTNLGYLVFGRVPLTEIIWAFSWGTCGGIWYKYAAGLRQELIVQRAQSLD